MKGSLFAGVVTVCVLAMAGCGGGTATPPGGTGMTSTSSKTTAAPFSLPAGTLWGSGGKTKVTDAADVYLTSTKQAFYLDSKGALWSIDPSDAAATPKKIAAGPFKGLSAGGSRDGFVAAVVDRNGEVWQWGRPFGLPGTDQKRVMDDVTYTIPKLTKVKDVTGVKKIAATATGIIALHDDGTVSTWGQNSDYNLLGRPTGENETSGPAKLSELQNIVDIAGGFPAQFAIDKSGTLWGWGSNNHGLLAAEKDNTDGKIVKVPVPGPVRSVVSSTFSAVAALQDGRVITWGGDSYLAVDKKDGTDSMHAVVIPNITGAQQVWFDARHGIAQTSSGPVGFGRAPAQGGGFEKDIAVKPMPWAGSRVMAASFAVAGIYDPDSFAMIVK